MDQAIETVINYGIAGVVIMAFFLGTSWLGKRLFGQEGLLVKLADQHLEFITHVRSTQEGIQKALDVSNDIQRSIVALNEESIERLEAMKRNDKTGILIESARGNVRLLRMVIERLEINAEHELQAIEASLKTKSGNESA